MNDRANNNYDCNQLSFDEADKLRDSQYPVHRIAKVSTMWINTISIILPFIFEGACRHIIPALINLMQINSRNLIALIFTDKNSIGRAKRDVLEILQEFFFFVCVWLCPWIPGCYESWDLRLRLPNREAGKYKFTLCKVEFQRKQDYLENNNKKKRVPTNRRGKTYLIRE